MSNAFLLVVDVVMELGSIVNMMPKAILRFGTIQSTVPCHAPPEFLLNPGLLHELQPAPVDVRDPITAQEVDQHI